MSVVPFVRFADCFEHSLAFRIKQELSYSSYVRRGRVYIYSEYDLQGDDRIPYKKIFVNDWARAPPKELYYDKCKVYKAPSGQVTPYYMTMLLHSPMGTGKTEFIIKAIEDTMKWKDLLFPRNWKVVYVSQRVTLAEETRSRFEKNLKIKFTLYSEVNSSQIQSSEYLIIQVDSLMKLANRFGEMPVIPLLIL